MNSTISIFRDEKHGKVGISFTNGFLKFTVFLTNSITDKILEEAKYASFIKRDMAPYALKICEDIFEEPASASKCSSCGQYTKH